MSPVDEFIYLYSLRTGMLFALYISLWILVATYFFKAKTAFY